MAAVVQNCPSFQNTAKKQLTSTGKYHRFIPDVPQLFDCRVKANIKKELKYTNLTVKDEHFKTNYFEDYPRKIILPNQWMRPPPTPSIEYTRTVEEKLRVNPPTPIPYPLSVMKDSFRTNYIRPQYEEDLAPSVLAKCNVIKLGSEQQPAIENHKRGFWKLTDPYLTNHKSDYIPYQLVNNVLAEKTLTFYNQNEFQLPAVSGNKTMYDKETFNNVLPGRLLTRAQARVPHFGMQSEYQGHYVPQTFSGLYPYLEDRCTTFASPLAPAARWQTLAAPGMYCSEYCSIGELSSVRKVVDLGPEKREFRRTEDCCPA